MPRLLTWSLVAATFCLYVAGCGGDGKLRTQGRVVMGGQPLLPKEDESIRVTFVPILPNGKPPFDHYHAEYQSFLARGHGNQAVELPDGHRRAM